MKIKIENQDGTMKEYEGTFEYLEEGSIKPPFTFHIETNNFTSYFEFEDENELNNFFKGIENFKEKISEFKRVNNEKIKKELSEIYKAHLNKEEIPKLLIKKYLSSKWINNSQFLSPEIAEAIKNIYYLDRGELREKEIKKILNSLTLI